MNAYKITNDSIFKGLFGTEGNEELLLFLLNSILEDSFEDKLIELEL